MALTTARTVTDQECTWHHSRPVTIITMATACHLDQDNGFLICRKAGHG